jgi:hypothetical protein
MVVFAKKDLRKNFKTIAVIYENEVMLIDAKKHEIKEEKTSR